MIEIRAAIEGACADVGINQVITKRGQIPEVEELPAAIVLLAGEDSGNPIKKRYIKKTAVFDIYLVVDGLVSDPDFICWQLKEKFREAYIERGQPDFADPEFYDTKINKTHPAKVARISTRKI